MSSDFKNENNTFNTLLKVTGVLICAFFSILLSSVAYVAGLPWEPGADSWGWGHAMAGFAGIVLGAILTIIITPILFAFKKIPTELKFIGTLVLPPIILFLFAATTSSLNQIKEKNKREVLKEKTETTIANPQLLKALIEKLKTNTLNHDEISILANALLNPNPIIQEEMPSLLKHFTPPNDTNSSELVQIIKHQKLTDEQFRIIYASICVSPGGWWWAIYMELISNPNTPVDILQDLAKRFPENSINHDVGEKAVTVLQKRNAGIESPVDWTVQYARYIADAKASLPPPPPPDHTNLVYDAKNKCLKEFWAHPELVTDDNFWKKQATDPDQIASGALLWFLQNPNYPISKEIKNYVLINFPDYFTALRDKKLLTKGDLESVVQNKKTFWMLANEAKDNIKSGNYIQDSQETQAFSQTNKTIIINY